MENHWIRYVNSARVTPAFSRRGTVALALELDWGQQQSILELGAEEFRERAMPLLGYPREHPRLTPLRELFCHGQRVLLYRLGEGGRAAQCSFGFARYKGARGNALSVTVVRWGEEHPGFCVATRLENKLVDFQTVLSASQLEDNDYVLWNREALLQPVERLPFIGGENPPPAGKGEYRAFLEEVESHPFHILGCCSPVREVQDLFIRFTRWMREREGALFQTVLPGREKATLGVLPVKASRQGQSPDLLVPWISGILASSSYGKSCEGFAYDGEYYPDRPLFLHCDSVGLMLAPESPQPARGPSSLKSSAALGLADQIANDMGVLYNRWYLGGAHAHKRDKQLEEKLGHYLCELEEQGVLEAGLHTRLVLSRGYGEDTPEITFPVQAPGEECFWITMIIY
ncbi:hypothetical protein U6B65_13125 [Oscillospiraceae bacterium MB08-C2-2]|nr:hypothetical protein U6B65_13125 [Oscillospiraceae bacterium MB08-C2-2]